MAMLAVVVNDLSNRSTSALDLGHFKTLYPRGRWRGGLPFSALTIPR